MNRRSMIGRSALTVGALALASASMAVSATSLRQAALDDVVFDCVVTEVGKELITVVCDTPDRQECKGTCTHTTRDIRVTNWKHFPEWQWQSTASLTRPVKQALPTVGELLKGEWRGNSFYAVESCDVRAYRVAIRICGDPPDYCRPPMNLHPYDCTKDKSDFIAQLGTRSKTSNPK